MYSLRTRKPISEEEALSRWARKCSVAEHCSGEVRNSCKEWGLSTEATNRIVSRLQADRYIDDSRYAPIFVKDKVRFSGWGPIKIRMTLLGKGIDEVLADNAIDSFDKQEWQGVLISALKTKLRTITSDDGQKIYASLVRFALSRGFSFDQVNTAIRQIRQEEK